MNLSGTCFLRSPEYDLSKKFFLKILNIFLWTSKKKGGLIVGQQISHSFENEKKNKNKCKFKYNVFSLHGKLFIYLFFGIWVRSFS